MATPGRARTSRFTTALLSLVLATACAHAARREVVASAADLRCEDASFFLAQQPPPSAADYARVAVTAPLAYVATGAGAAGAAVVLVPGGVVVGGLVCSPIIALEAALKSDGEASGNCIGEVALPLVTAGTVAAGAGIYRATRTWRCLDRTGESRETRAVARCYAERRWPGDLDVARTLLLALKGPSGAYRCVSDAERRAVDSALDALSPGAAPDAVLPVAVEAAVGAESSYSPEP